MSKLKLGAIEHEKPVTMTIKLPAAVHRDLAAYAELLTREYGHAIDPNSAHCSDADAIYGDRSGIQTGAKTNSK